MPNKLLQDTIRRARMTILQCQIERMQRRFIRCSCDTPGYRKTMLRYLDLIRQRNDLRTTQETAAIEKERGLV